MDGVNPQPDIAGAIRRAREARSAMRSRRRRLALILVCACAAGGIPLSLSVLGMSGNDVVHAAAGGAQNLLDLLDRRSPGARTEGQLTKTKHARALARMHAPVLRGPQATAAGPPPGQAELAAILMPAPVDLPMPAFAPVAQLDLGPPPSLGGIIGPGGPSSSSPGGPSSSSPGGPSSPGGGSPATFPGPESREPVTVAAPVPEPATWATMLLGFAFIGWRTRKSAARTGARLPV